ncbi:MAG: hypothetical protein HY231_02175 [Acidobacteria bacterium]|nr:hypothetical protein [Acidobacteriota bacterium]
MMLSDEEFIERFESCELPLEEFHHADHVRLAWLYLQTLPVLEALTKFSAGLQRFAAAKGKAGLYHETITWAYLFLIHERLKRDHQKPNWQEFAAANADLLDWQSSVLKRYYSNEVLFSDLARQVFVFPDRITDHLPTSERMAVEDRL